MIRTAAFFALIGLSLPATAVHGASVALDIATDHDLYLEATRNDIDVAARIVAPAPAPNAPRTPRNVVFVLDRSGSMAGERIEALRTAAARAITALEPTDAVGVVAFGSEVEIMIPSQARGNLADVAGPLARIEPAGGAALYDALNQAAAEVRRHMAPAQLNQIVLVTDGPATKGPREVSDFMRLTEAFASEGIIVSTLGIGEDFDEDMLADMARVGGGTFQYADAPRKLETELPAAVPPLPPTVGTNAELRFDFRRSVENARASDWSFSTTTDHVVTYRLGRLYAGETVNRVASAALDASFAQVFVPNFVTVRLRWTATDDGEQHEIVRTLALNFSNDLARIRASANVAALRLSVDNLLREGLQHAIEAIDAHDPRRIVHELQLVLDEAKDANFDLNDPGIARQIGEFETQTAALQKNLPPSERKTLRAGLDGLFQPPRPVPELRK